MAEADLAFGAGSPGTQEFIGFFRRGALRYLLPLSALFAAVYVGIGFFMGTAMSPLVYLLVAAAGLSYGVYQLGYVNLALRIFLLSAIPLLLCLNIPSAERSSGFATGGAYLFCLIPVIWWMCFAERRGRLAILATCVIALAIIAATPQHASSYVQVPEKVVLLSLLRTYFIIALTMCLCHGFELSIARFDGRWRRSYFEQQQLTLKLDNQKRDLQREAKAHRSTLVHLSRSESRYRSLFDKAFDGIVIFDAARNLPVEINRGMCETLGYTFGEISNKSPLDMSPHLQPDGRRSAAAREEILSYLDRGEDHTYEWTHLSKSGKELDFEVTTFCVPGEDNVRVSVFRNITERKIAQQELESANRELKTFAHAASHDLKEPLRTMSNFAKLLKRRYANQVDENGREYIRFITDAAERGTQLVQDLLEYAEVGTGEVSTVPVSLHVAATTVRQTVAARLEEEGATLRIQQLPTVLATATWAQQLLQNLISNALKFRRAGVAPVVEVSASSNGFGHEIRVADNGIGIAAEDIDKVFGVFQRLVGREQYEGNGIGLALCRRIMSKLNGDIRVESVLGKGTTFILWFPPIEAFGSVTVAASPAGYLSPSEIAASTLAVPQLNQQQSVV